MVELILWIVQGLGVRDKGGGGSTTILILTPHLFSTCTELH